MHNQILVTCPTPVFIFMIFNWQTVLPYKMLIKERDRERISLFSHRLLLPRNIQMSNCDDNCHKPQLVLI